jgi:hypothetical protein
MSKEPVTNTIFVTSHVPRDLLQNAALFKTDKLVVWEYVSNGLEYVDEGVNPIVRVTLDAKKKRIIVDDNGRGMDWEGLQNFFIMHGENIDRKQGKPGRGRFGTGKSAALGIGDILRITTIRKGKRSKVELRRSDIEDLQSGDPIPLQTFEREERTEQRNGTKVEIEGIHLKSFDQEGIKRYVERHLSRWRNGTVFVNNHPCEFSEPPVASTTVYRPEGETGDILGDVQLIIKVTTMPLDEESRGVSIFSNQVWYQNTLAGNENREWSNYIFGEIDVPKLDEDKSPIPPFDLSRSMELNPNNPVVAAIYAFIGHRIDLVRRELALADKQRKATEEAKKLAKQAREIARIINEDFSDFHEQVTRAKAKAGQGFDAGPEEAEAGSDENEVVFGNSVSADVTTSQGGLGATGNQATGGKEPRELMPQVEYSAEAEKKGQYAGERDGRRTSRGGFSVDFREMGKEAPRAKFASEERSIFINLDHPQLTAAKGTNSVDDPVFKKLSYEVAFTEYAIALAAELNSSGQYGEISDPILDIRDTVNRIARKVASLYAS